MADKDFKIKLGDKEISLQLKDLAPQANGNVLIRLGDTVVLAVATMTNAPIENPGFFPLTVEYEEKFYAAGKILGSRFVRREGRPSDEAIITSRLIDRTIRPLFPKHLNRAVQIIVSVLSWDAENDPDVIGLLGASLALSLSDIPWTGPVAVVRIGRVENTFVINPSYEERAKSDIDLMVAGIRQDGEILINMIEAEANEISEEVFVNALQTAKPELEKLIEFQLQIIKQQRKEKLQLPKPLKDQTLEQEILDFIGNKLEKALFEKDKTSRMDKVGELKEEMVNVIEKKYPDAEKGGYAKNFFEEELDRIMRLAIFEKGERIDKRKPDEVRELASEVNILPRTHGSGLFSRGSTKTLSIITLGTPGDQKLVEGMEVSGKKRFMHHYNFPPYSVGEVRPLRGPGRREIGHGTLAEKALLPLMPTVEEFPYTIRIVTEVVSSNGSSSMASVCSSSLALMDAGVPIKRPVAGIAMGLVTNEKEYKILTDIQGPEDHYGDMDLKVAGTTEGITAIQMDVKLWGISERIFKESLEAAKKARLHILSQAITKTILEPRKELSEWAPRIYTLHISPDKIGGLIGPGGKIIRQIIEECEVEIDVEDDGTVFITATKKDAAKKAIEWIKGITKEIVVGEIFNKGLVKKTVAFGAFVEIAPNKEGLVHISELAPRRVEKVEDVVKIGDIIPVKVIGIDEQGKIKLSLKQVKE